MDQSKKTMRHFYCRDVLWETFEQMANDFDCSIDYLVNEAMRYYARSKNYQPPGGGPQMPGAPVATGGNTASGPTVYPAGPKPTPGGGNGMRNPPATAPPPQAGGGSAAAGGRRGVPPTPGYPNNNNPNVRAAGPTGAGGGGGGMAALQHSPAPTTGHSPAPISTMGSSGPTLFLIYNGQRYPVTKDQFIIGRGSKTSDLPIKDGNISRKHAAVIRRNGTFYIKDLGSTNGIDYKGMRIDNKRIDEGDVFHLCDYELRFTYRAD
jgi:hypothetical protein